MENPKKQSQHVAVPHVQLTLAETIIFQRGFGLTERCAIV